MKTAIAVVMAASLPVLAGPAVGDASPSMFLRSSAVGSSVPGGPSKTADLVPGESIPKTSLPVLPGIDAAPPAASAPAPARQSPSAQLPSDQAPGAPERAPQPPAAQAPSAPESATPPAVQLPPPPTAPAPQPPTAQPPAAQAPIPPAPIPQAPPTAQAPAPQPPAAQAPTPQPPTAQAPAPQPPTAPPPTAQAPAPQPPTPQPPAARAPLTPVPMPPQMRQATPSAPPEAEAGRYSFHRMGDAFLRLDTTTGQVAQCGWSPTGWSCKPAPEERAALESEINRLQRENAALKQSLLSRGLELPGGPTAQSTPPQGQPPQSAAPKPPADVPDTSKDGAKEPKPPSQAEIDRAIAFVKSVWQRLIEMMADLQRDIKPKS